MRILRNKLFIGCLCILLALLVGFVLIPVLNKKQTETTVVLQLKQAISDGEAVNKAMLEPVEIPIIAAPQNAVKGIDEANGKLAASL